MLALLSWPQRLSLALLTCASFSACTTTRGLEITEVGVGVVELYLDEPADKTLQLRDVDLLFKGHGSGGSALEEGSVPLFGSIAGGEYLVVWEKPSYSGPPSRENYTNFHNQSVRGIAVAEGTFGTVDNARSYSYRVYGKRFIYIFPFFYRYEESDDVVTFGPTPRPEIGGTFFLTGALDNVQRSMAVGVLRGQTVWRKTRKVNGIDVPFDNDLESDWRQDDESFGKAK